ncbi:Fic family protein, partial [Candidatus Nomurabacteria bacterium]|nr:Fic family protein [Candidatus Nomurabacteria bacterium]
RFRKIFYSCNRYPDCKFALWDKPLFKTCPKCQFPILTEKLTKKLGRFHEKIEIIHPFANGNGRFGRILADYFCKRQNLQAPTWGVALQNIPKSRRQAYITALNCARHNKDYKPLIKFMFS